VRARFRTQILPQPLNCIEGYLPVYHFSGDLWLEPEMAGNGIHQVRFGIIPVYGGMRSFEHQSLLPGERQYRGQFVPLG